MKSLQDPQPPPAQQCCPSQSFKGALEALLLEGRVQSPCSCLIHMQLAAHMLALRQPFLILSPSSALLPSPTWILEH